MVLMNEKSKMQKYIQHIISIKFKNMENNSKYCSQIQSYVIKV